MTESLEYLHQGDETYVKWAEDFFKFHSLTVCFSPPKSQLLFKPTHSSKMLSFQGSFRHDDTFTKMPIKH